MSIDPIVQLLEQALALHQAGQLQQAEPIYRQVLGRQANQPDALRLLGILSFQLGQLSTAIELLGRAAMVEPQSFEVHYALGQALAQSGRLSESASAFHRALSLNPQSADVNNDLANVLLGLDRVDEAISLYQKSLTIRPNSPPALNNLGTALSRKRLFNEAVMAYRQALSLLPDFPEAQCNLGIALQNLGQKEPAIAAFEKALRLRPQMMEASVYLADAMREQGRFDDGIALLRQALAYQPNHPDLNSSLGSMLQAAERPAEAVIAFRRAIQIAPQRHEFYYNLGTALSEEDDLEGAISANQQALKLRPDYPNAHNNLGNALLDSLRVNEAVLEFRHAIALSPELPSAHFNLGVALLMQGNLKEGFQEFDWRWRTLELVISQMRLSGPRWSGERMDGRRLLLHAEQGFGDTIQFIRYLPRAVESRGTILLACQPELARLIGAMPGISQLVTQGDRLPQYDAHCPLLSLPLVFGTELSTIPSQVPYLKTDEVLKSRWRARLQEYHGSLKVGLTWASRPKHKLTKHKSVSLNALEPLKNIRGVKYISLQKAPISSQSDLPLIDWTSDLTDFAETAALIENLDLVITVDTAVAHLAGALGKPVWVLLRYASDWRWLLDRNDTPWYPSMRLFRQPKIGDWQSVIEEVCAELKCLK